MAGSSYYYSMYKQKRKEAEDYSDNLDDLNRILGNLTDDLYDEISAVNNEIDDLMEDLKDGIRHNSIFTSRANEFINKKEKSVGLDSHLRVSEEALEDEIERVKQLRLQAITDRDRYYQLYEEAKAAERAAEERAAAERRAAAEKAASEKASTASSKK